MKKQVKKQVSRSTLQEKKRNDKSTVKFPVIDFDLKKLEDKKEEGKDSSPSKKKPKPEMKDAWTQTDRSDYAIIKSRLAHHQSSNPTPSLYTTKDPTLY